MLLFLEILSFICFRPVTRQEAGGPAPPPLYRPLKPPLTISLLFIFFFKKMHILTLLGKKGQDNFLDLLLPWIKWEYAKYFASGTLLG